MTHYYAPGKLQASLVPYQDRQTPRPTVTRSPYAANTLPRHRNPGSPLGTTTTRSIFGFTVKTRGPLSPASPGNPASPFGPTVRFRYPPTTPTTPTVQTPFGPSLRPRTPSTPLSPTSQSPFGPSIRARSPSPVTPNQSPLPNQYPYYPGTLNRNSPSPTLSQYPYPGYSIVQQNRNSYEANSLGRNSSSVSTLNRYPAQSMTSLNRNPSYAESIRNRKISYEAPVNRFSVNSMNSINRNPSSIPQTRNRKASFEVPPHLMHKALSRNPSHEASPASDRTGTPTISRSPSVTSTKRKGPHTNNGSRLLSKPENDGIYSILGKGRQVFQITGLYVFSL